MVQPLYSRERTEDISKLWRRLHILPGKPVPVLGHYTGRKFFPMSMWNFLDISFSLLPLVLLLHIPEQSPSPSSEASLQIFIHIDAVPSQLSFLKDEQVQSLQTFIIRELLQSLNYLCSPLDSLQDFPVSLVLRSPNLDTVVFHMCLTGLSRWRKYFFSTCRQWFLVPSHFSDTFWNSSEFCFLGFFKYVIIIRLINVLDSWTY